MPKRVKRQPSDTTSSIVAAFAAAALGPVKPPATVKLRDGDVPFWELVSSSRARSEWSQTDLHHGANLARCLADIERISLEIREEGDTLKNERGTVVMNAKHSLLETLSRRAVTLTRLLGLQSALVVGPAADVAKSRETEVAARELLTLAQRDDDGLLATPGHAVQ
jgi:hypothetical protein